MSYAAWQGRSELAGGIYDLNPHCITFHLKGGYIP